MKQNNIVRGGDLLLPRRLVRVGVTVLIRIRCYYYYFLSRVTDTHGKNKTNVGLIE